MPDTAGSRLPLAVFLILAAVVALILSLSCPAAAVAIMDNDDDYGGGRVVVTTDDRGRTRVDAAAAAGTGAAPSSKWRGSRVEEAVAPEFGGLLAADQRYINYDTLTKNRPACGRSGCAAQGASYTLPCLAIYRCRG